MVNQPSGAGGGTGGKSSVPLIDDGGPAFPVDTLMEVYPGMSRRDYIAIHAAAKEIDFLMPRHESGETLETICRIRYKYADAMIKESKKQ